MKKIFLGTSLLVLGVTALLAAEHSPDRPDGTVKVVRRDVEVTVEAVGEINPANQVTVKAEVSGRIRSIAVVVGQTVKRGELLLALDDTDLLTERQAAQTEIDGAQLQLTKAQRDFTRNKELFESKLVSKETYDNSKTERDLAQNDFERAERRLQTVEDKLQKVRIVAPFDGTVLTLAVSKGQVVSGATSVSQGTELMTFADLNELVIRPHISQVDIAKMETGQVATITVNSLTGVKMEGRVILIAPVATVKTGIKGFSMDVLITRGAARIRPGMNANVVFPISRAEHVLTVPVSVVFTEGKEKVVYIPKGTGYERRVVELGASDYKYCEVTSGLNEGDIVASERPTLPPTKP